MKLTTPGELLGKGQRGQIGGHFRLDYDEPKFMWMNLRRYPNFCAAEKYKSQSALSNFFIQFIWHIDYATQKEHVKFITFFTYDRYGSCSRSNTHLLKNV